MNKLIYSSSGFSYKNDTSEDIPGGAVLVIGQIVGVVLETIAPGSVGWICAEGVWELASVSGELAAGSIAYWDASKKQVTGTAASNKPIGYNVAASPSGQTTSRVLIVQGLTTSAA